MNPRVWYLGLSEADVQHVTAIFPTCCAVLLTVRWCKYLSLVLEIPLLDFEESHEFDLLPPLMLPGS